MADLPTIAAPTLEHLMQEGSEAWEEFRIHAQERFHLFIPCDHRLAYETLRELRPRASSFVELGAGAGVVTIMADLLGFEAFGIEIEPWLVDRSVDIAERFDSRATFAEGTFVPPGYQEETQHLSGDHFTPTDGACAFSELGLELCDFDLVFAYPWPQDEEWLGELIGRYARPDVIFLTYDANEGFRETPPTRP